MDLYLPETGSYGGVGLTDYDPYSVGSYGTDYSSAYDPYSSSSYSPDYSSSYAADNSSFSTSPWLYQETEDVSTDQSLNTFNEVMEMVGKGADWLEGHESLLSLGGGLATGIMNWSNSDILQDQYNREMQYNYDKMNLSEEQMAKQLEISQQLADASFMNAETNRMRAEWGEDQRQQHNTGISSFGSKYGK